MSCTTVELRVARAIARWNLRSSWRNRSSFSRKSSALASARLRSISRGHRGEVLLACVHRGELRHARLEQAARLEHSGHLAHANRLAAPEQIARNQLGRHEDPAGLAPAHLEHSRLGQHLHRLAQRRAADAHHAPPARARTAAGRPMCRSPALIRSAICSTASSKVRRDETGSNELSKPASGYPAMVVATSRLSVAGGVHALERLALCHLDRRRALGLGGLEGAALGAPSRRRSARARPGRDRRTTRWRRGSARRSWRGSPGRRGCPRSISVRATPRSVSGLFAAPAITRQSSARASASSIRPPRRAGGEHVELAREDRLGRRRELDSVLRAESLAALGVEVARDHARAGLDELCRRAREPTLPSPTTPTRLPSRLSRPGGRAGGRAASPWKTVSAVTGEGSPPPPPSRERPTAKRVKRDRWSMSAVVVPMSSAVM